ncbi:helix-turn-helix domain-containing protein [Candidatus Poribacteria bacterium]|nr:helix-turn-helix domain-containing protein [Candidatus Poribacteria bacterium]
MSQSVRYIVVCSDFGQRIRRSREGRGWKQQVLASEAGVSLSTIKRIENIKENESLSLIPSTLHRIANALGTMLDELLTEASGDSISMPAAIGKLLAKETSDTDKKNLLETMMPRTYGRGEVVELLDVLFGNIEAKITPQQAHFYRSLIDLLEANAPNEEIRAYALYFKIAFLYFRLGSKEAGDADREAILSACYKLLEHPIAQTNLDLKFRVCQKVARLFFYMQKYEKAIEYYGQAQIAAKKLGDMDRLSYILRETGEIADAVGDFEYAHQLLKEAVDKATSTKEKARCLQRLGTTLNHNGYLCESELILLESLPMWEQVYAAGLCRLNDLAEIQQNVADLYNDWFRFDKSLHWIQKVRRTLKDRLSEEPDDLFTLYQKGIMECAEGWAYLGMGEAKQAYRIFQKVEATYRNFGYSYVNFLHSLIYRGLGCTSRRLGAYDNAIFYFEKVLSTDFTPNPVIELEVKLWLAALRLDRWDDKQFARQMIQDVIKNLKVENQRHKFIWCQLYCLQGRLDFAEKRWDTGYKAYCNACVSALEWNVILLHHPVKEEVAKQIQELVNGKYEKQVRELLIEIEKEPQLVEEGNFLEAIQVITMEAESWSKLTPILSITGLT